MLAPPLGWNLDGKHAISYHRPMYRSRSRFRTTFIVAPSMASSCVGFLVEEEGRKRRSEGGVGLGEEAIWIDAEKTTRGGSWIEMVPWRQLKEGTGDVESCGRYVWNLAVECCGLRLLGRIVDNANRCGEYWSQKKFVPSQEETLDFGLLSCHRTFAKIFRLKSFFLRETGRALPLN